MRIRTIKPEYFHSEKIAQLSFPARYLYAGMWCYSDDYGRSRNNVRLIRASIFPLDEDVMSSDVGEWLKEIVNLEMLHQYTVDAKDYFHIVDWFTNQAPSHRRSAGVHPAPTCMQGDEMCMHVSERCTQKSAGTGKGNREQGAGRGMLPSNPEERI